MKRRKVLELIRLVRDEVKAEPQYPVTFDQLVINFPDRKVTFRGRTITVDAQAVTFPVLTTDRLIVTKNHEDVL